MKKKIGVTKYDYFAGITPAILELAISAMKTYRRAHFAMGEEAYKKGVDFTFAVTGHANYVKYTEAIEKFEDLIDIMNDPGATIEPEAEQLGMDL